MSDKYSYASHNKLQVAQNIEWLAYVESKSLWLNMMKHISYCW